MAARKTKTRFTPPDLTVTPRRRPVRVADMMRQEIADLLLRKINDPRLVNASIMRVTVSDDLSVATVYFGCGDDPVPEAVAGLASASGYIRTHLAKCMSLRVMPILVFKHDDTLIKQAEMERLLREIADEDKKSV